MRNTKSNDVQKNAVLTHTKLIPLLLPYEKGSWISKNVLLSRPLNSIHPKNTKTVIFESSNATSFKLTRFQNFEQIPLKSREILKKTALKSSCKSTFPTKHLSSQPPFNHEKSKRREVLSQKKE